MVIKSPKWRVAMAADFGALQYNGTWSLVLVRPRINIIGCKWVYKMKHSVDGSVAWCKARLVAKGVLSTTWC